ncbi:MAG TPA: DNA polymerase III subunit gamma/tau [Chitinophagaceae bacterium]|nr:DNA polymerase III subunit gamma/tau [Chitinophagaceae bacterium]
MEHKFIVSARKYRPQNFETVVGQSHITTTLKNAIRNNQLAHAFLFCGPRGVGKTTCARILAKTINCVNISPEGEACNKCNSCISFNEGTSLNIHELDAASNNSVDDIRALVEQVRFTPQAGKYKVYIIDEVHMLSSSAFNAFLKTLEEPPPYAIFILATTEKHKILPTILSRCQIFDFKRITIQDTVSHLQHISLKEEIKAEPEAMQLIAQKSEGCMRDALSILDKIVSFTNGEVTYQNTLEHLNILDAEYYFKLMDQLQQQDLVSAMLLYDDINRKGFEGDLVIEGFAEFIRNLLVCKDQRAAALLEVVESFKAKYYNSAKKMDPAYLVSALNILNEVQINYKQARNKRLHVELALIKLCYLQQALQLVSSDSAPGKKKLIDSAVAFRISPIRAVKKITPGQEEDQQKRLSELSKDEPDQLPGTISKGKSPEPKLIIQSEREIKSDVGTLVEDVPRPYQSIPASGVKLTSLDKIRQQVSTANGGNPALEARQLSEEDLHQAWGLFTLQLREAKNHAAQSFSMAELRISDANSFLIVVPNNIQQRFIESVRQELLEFLKKHFNNKMLSFSISLEEKRSSGDSTPAPLSRKEQYLKMIEQYPLVKELKDRLRLELDY